jgi:hypothetical protein
MVDRLRSASVSKLNNKLIGVNRRLCHHNHQQYDAECRANAERCERLAETLGRTTGRPAEGRGAAKITATRHLATILAAKVAGYSRLMGAGEEGALERLKALRRELAARRYAILVPGAPELATLVYYNQLIPKASSPDVAA